LAINAYSNEVLELDMKPKVSIIILNGRSKLGSL